MSFMKRNNQCTGLTAGVMDKNQASNQIIHQISTSILKEKKSQHNISNIHIPNIISDIFCCGLLSTRKSDCTGLPQSMLVCSSTPAQRGQSRVMMKGSMSLISWYNKGHFRFLSNAYSPTKQGNDRNFFLPRNW